jgi:hypothetical protein
MSHSHYSFGTAQVRGGAWPGWAMLDAPPDNGHVHPAYNPYFLACFFSRNSIFLSQQISQQCFSVGLSAQPNRTNDELQACSSHQPPF